MSQVRKQIGGFGNGVVPRSGSGNEPGWLILHRPIDQEGTGFQARTWEAEMDKRAAEIERFVRHHNIEHYRKLLGESTDPVPTKN
jgi:hypothetical protein